jgi:U1 small nuclear ribonucleoprotein 70kDa
MSAQGMPPNLMVLFAPRAPLVFLEPPKSKYSRGFRPVYTGIHDFIHLYSNEVVEKPEPIETPNQRRQRKKEEKLQEHKKKQKELINDYNPLAVDCATKNPYATLFVGRLSYETTEKKLKKEFEVYGQIKRLKVITDFNGRSRGYAFIEYDHEADLKQAYKQGDGKKIDGRRVLVDVERSRTVAGWIPRRLGGGKGPARFTESKKKLANRLIAAPPVVAPNQSTLSKGSWEHGSQSNHTRRTSTSSYAGSGNGNFFFFFSY